MKNLNTLYDTAKQQGLRDIVQFMEDMENAGLDPFYYQGRFFWKGPAVTVPDIQVALSRTSVQCKWDNLGKDFVVHPRQSFP